MTTSELDPRFADTKYVVEIGGSYEKLALWSEYSIQGSLERRRDMSWIPEELRRRYEWVQDNPGTWIEIGQLANMPVCVSFFWDFIDGVRVMFYELSSQVTDMRMVESWLQNHCDPKYKNRPAHCNAMNFAHCLEAVRDLREDLKPCKCGHRAHDFAGKMYEPGICLNIPCDCKKYRP